MPPPYYPNNTKPFHKIYDIIVDHDDPDVLDDNKFDTKMYLSHLNTDKKYVVGFVLLAAYRIDGVRYANEKLPNEFTSSLRAKVDVLYNFHSADTNAKILLRNKDDPGKEFIIEISKSLEIAIASLPYSEMRVEGDVYCDFILYQTYVRREMALQPKMINYKYHAYGGKVMCAEDAIKKYNDRCCTII